MEQEIGRVVIQLKTMGAFENTLLLFLYETGASAEIIVLGDGHDPVAHSESKSFPCLLHVFLFLPRPGLVQRLQHALSTP